VTDLDHKTEDGKFIVTGIHCLRQDKSEVIAVNDGDFVFLQNGSMTDASSLGSMTSAPEKLTKRIAAAGLSGKSWRRAGRSLAIPRPLTAASRSPVGSRSPSR
jgi:myosin-crossreactive antigen